MHFALVKNIWGPLFDDFGAIQILTIWGQRSGSDPQPKKIGSLAQKDRIPRPRIISFTCTKTNT